MAKMRPAALGKSALVLGLALLGALTGCVSYDDRPRGGAVYSEPPVYVQSAPVVQPEYVYYPGYQVYYSPYTHRYIYQDGRSWVARPAPRVSVDVLYSSPSVSLNFHDHPSQHHATVVRQYPKNWAPPGQNHGRNQGQDERYRY